MSPIDTVPPEILGEIFSVLSLPATRCAEDVTCIDAGAAPLVLSLVSARWRQIALSHSAIWASFKILIKTTATPQLVPIVALWLERAAGQLLSFTVWMDPFVYMNPGASEASEGIMLLLGKRINRWRRVTLVLPGSRVPAFAAALCSHLSSNNTASSLTKGEETGTDAKSVPSSMLPLNLEYASFSLGNWVAPISVSHSSPDTDVTSFLAYAPKLKTLAWSARAEWGCWDVPHYSGIEKLRMHWHQLTDLRLDTWITLRIALEILEQCPAIERFEMNHFVSGDAAEEADVTVFDADAAVAGGIVLAPNGMNGMHAAAVAQTQTDVLKRYTPSTPLHLQHLSSLSIYQLHLSHSLAGLFSRIACPALSSFSFSCGFVADQKWPQDAFHDMLARSGSGSESDSGSGGAQLKELFLEYSGINEEQLVQCLEDSSDRLESLELYDGRGCICVTDSLLQRLQAPQVTTTTAIAEACVPQLDTRGLSSSVWKNSATRSDSDTILCPKLKRLVMHYVVECEDGALTKMLLSRVPPATVQNYRRMQSQKSDGASSHSISRGRLNGDGINDHYGGGNHIYDATSRRERCARLEFVDAMFSKTYLARNSVDTAFLRTLSARR
ncbi:hypothetical protein D9619_001506 [Psilocybe cf. subviscida]|uniref:F-box domain-containing protein n=1 Tax=Psilocybe cf. subviscida TaxID=2480587 RepID=A0A8H5F2I8_9AGAR|nr:hypothetical protein D9619_001506 [Psilocybe cf. subviscida]